jgi:hypothetical protein
MVMDHRCVVPFLRDAARKDIWQGKYSKQGIGIRQVFPVSSCKRMT